MFAVVDGSRTAAVAEPEGELRTGGRLDELDRAAAGDGEPFARLVADDLHAIPTGSRDLGTSSERSNRRRPVVRRIGADYHPSESPANDPLSDPRQTRQFGSIDQYGPRL